MTNAKQNKVDDIMEKLEQGITELFDSEQYRAYLNVMTKFHTYSFNNCMLILLQKPEATCVAGYKSWEKNFNRNVRRGEKAIKILAPIKHTRTMTVEDEDGNEVEKQSTFYTYKPVSVFDISQTEGEELPDIVKELDGKVDDYEGLRAKLEEISPVSVTYKPIANGANGYYKLDDKAIVIRDDLSETHTIKTLIHEISHAILHNLEDGAEKEADRRTCEVQAESVAYTVCNYLGLDTSDYSFGYIVHWSKGREIKELRASMEVIRKTASQIISKLSA